jgi:hypothetical protein
MVAIQMGIHQLRVIALQNIQILMNPGCSQRVTVVLRANLIEVWEFLNLARVAHLAMLFWSDNHRKHSDYS